MIALANQVSKSTVVYRLWHHGTITIILWYQNSCTMAFCMVLQIVYFQKTWYCYGTCLENIVVMVCFRSFCK